MNRPLGSALVPSGERGKSRAEPRVRVLGSQGSRRSTQAALVRRAARQALSSGGWEGAATVDVLLRDENAMRTINAESRGIEEATDVLSFPMLELRPGQARPRDAFVLPPGTTPHLGDVVVCTSRAEEQALAYGHSFERELAYLTVHGVLHLLGYDHERPSDRRRMREREEASLAALGLPRNSSPTAVTHDPIGSPPRNENRVRGVIFMAVGEGRVRAL